MKYFHEQWLCGVYLINFEIWGKEKMGGIKSYKIHIKLELMYVSSVCGENIDTKSNKFFTNYVFKRSR